MATNDIDLGERKVGVSPFTGQAVDIIIPFYGQYDQVGTLIKSIWAATKSNDYEITLVDDGSPNPTFAEQIQKAKIPRMNVVRHADRRGFGAALHTGYKVSKNPWVVFMHSDCVVEDVNWLLSLGRSYLNLRGQNVKLISARLTSYAGGDPRTRGHRGTKNRDIILEPKGLDDILEKDCYVPLACAFAHRQLFTQVGFIKPYPLGWYEDLEFACRMRSAGYLQAISGNAWVYHKGGATFDAVFQSEPEAKDVVEENFYRATEDIRQLSISQ